jgi:hypothetical protein
MTTGIKAYDGIFKLRPRLMATFHIFGKPGRHTLQRMPGFTTNAQ